MSEIIRGWKKDEFSTPDLIWNLDLDGTIVEERKNKKTGEIKYVEVNVSGSSVKLVYLYLVRCLDIDKKVFPSISTIEKHTQLSNKTVIRCLRYLEEIGLIEIHQRYKINEKGKKVHDSNLYIVKHPKQVPGLKYLEGTVMSTQPLCNDYTTPSVMSTQPLCNDYTTPSVMSTQNINSSSSNNNTSSSSVENTQEYQVLYQILNKAWKDCFQEDLEEWEFLKLMQLRDFDFIMQQIGLIKEHHDISTIDSPYAFVSSCLKKKNGYKVPKKKKSQQQPKQPKQPEKSKLPKAVAQQLEEEKNGTPGQRTMSEEELAERKRKVDEKLKLLESLRPKILEQSEKIRMMS